MKMPKPKPIKPGEKIEDRIKGNKAWIQGIKELPRWICDFCGFKNTRKRCQCCGADRCSLDVSK
jgi:hypothetical protein